MGKPIRPELNVVPESSEERCKEIAKDIDEVGQLVPILLYEGAIIDGRTRDKAIEKYCKSGVEPWYEDYDGDLPAYRLAYSLNLRRDLTASQRAMMVLTSWEKYKADAKERQRESGRTGPRTGALTAKASEAAAKDAGVSARTIEDAAVVVEHGSKRLQRQVRSGKLSAKAAAKQVREAAPKSLTRDQMMKKVPEEIREEVSKVGTATIERLIEYKPADQKKILALVDGVKNKTIAAAIGEFDNFGSAPRDQLKKVIPEKFRKFFADTWYDDAYSTLMDISKEAKKRTTNHYLDRDLLTEPVEQAARKAQDAKPAVICPACDGDGCEWCMLAGWMPAHVHRNYKAKMKARS